MENKTEVKKRQILIETDGVNVQLVKAEVASPIELTAILNMIIEFVIQNSKKDIKKEEVLEKKEEKVK